MKPSRRTLLIMCTCAVAFAGIALSAVALARTTNHPRHHARHVPKPAARHVSVRLVKHFALFRNQRRIRSHAAVASVAPAPVESVLQSLGSSSDPSNQRQLLNPALTQQFDTGAGSLWVMPGTNGVCVVTATPPATQGMLAGQPFTYTDCDSTADVLSIGLLAVGLEADGTHIVYGIVPDGNSTVTATLADGTTQTLPVVDNTVVAHLPSMPSALSLKNGSGAVVNGM